jgi:hypothetical protein
LLPDEVAFLENFFAQNEYRGYLTFENGKQEDWLVTKMMGTDESKKRDTLLIEMGDTLSARGFEYVGMELIDSAICLQNLDSSYTYVKNVGNTTYKVYVKKSVKWGYSSISGMFPTGYGFELKIVALESGLEEKQIVSCSSLRFEDDLPEEVKFLNEYATSKSKFFWSDDSLAISWSIRDETAHETLSRGNGEPVTWYLDHPDSTRLLKEKEDDAWAEQERIKQALVENEFSLVKVDSVESYCSLDSLTQIFFYVRETSIARYEVQVKVQTMSSNISINVIDDYYGVTMTLDVFYKNRRE